MRTLSRSFALGGVALLLSLGLQAATYYVLPTGDDALNPGSQTKPWRTVQRAADAVVAGDTVIVGAGTYEGTSYFSRGGTTSARVNFKASGKVVVGAVTIGAPNITFEGFEITGPLVQWTAAIRLRPNAHNTWLYGNNLHDFVYAYGITMDTSGRLPEEGPQSCIISNNVFNQIGYVNVNLYGADHLVTANRFANSWGEGDTVRPWGARHRIISNVMTNMGGGLPGGIGGHPDLIQSFGDLGYGSSDLLFERNLAINCGKSQICQIEQKGVEDIRDWTIRNNVFIGMGMAANCSIPGIWWLNNTFYRCTTNTGHVLVFSDGSNGKGFAWRSGAKNNVFLECGSRPDNNTFGWYIFPETLTDLDCDYNFVAGTNFAPKRNDDGPRLWRFVEAHGINGGDPRLASIANYDFRPTATSPLVDRGIAISSFARDFSDSVRPAGAAWDIGAHEYRDALFISSPRNLRVLTP